ncbi:DUF3653 domain-containing protein [Lysobacter gummosus]|uniref:DUF3653 domain-containing protein n=1 Tax=Lysobacter gummosus TaxID=262324 RepID=UPI00362E1848
MTTRPPCWPDNQPCPNNCAAALHERVVYNRQDLTGPWQGWRFRGRDLISPNGTRMSPERLQGLAWREHSEARLIQVRSRNAATKAAKIGSR